MSAFHIEVLMSYGDSVVNRWPPESPGTERAWKTRWNVSGARPGYGVPHFYPHSIGQSSITESLLTAGFQGCWLI